MRQEIDLVSDLRRQSLVERRQVVYDGHNRRPQRSTMSDLSERRYRRLWNQRMTAMVQSINSRRSN